MKTNFLVSAHAKARIPGASQLFITDPYARHALEQAGNTEKYERITVAPPLRATRETFRHDHEFVDGRHRKYVEILARRLNEVHGTAYQSAFWQKAFSLALLRHVTFCFDMFQYCRTHLRPELHECRILAESSFHVPEDFNEHRRFFQHSDLGQEQLFASYCRMFHLGQFSEYEDTHSWHAAPSAAPRRRRGLRETLARLPRGLARRLLRLRSPTVAIVKSFFSEQNLERLLLESRGRIQYLELPKFSLPGRMPDPERRHALCREEAGFDAFDRFVFQALRHGMPKAFVEHFEELSGRYRALLQVVPSVRWIVSEAWIGDADSALFLALAREAGKRHLYNEHNYLGHPFLGNNLKYIYPLVDEFATLGWASNGIPNLVPAASLFPWTAEGNPGEPRGILFVASIPNARAPEINASYGESGPFAALSYLRMVRSFLGALSDAALRQVTFRDYPSRHRNEALHLDQRHFLKDYLARVRAVNEAPGSARTLMRQAALVVIGYLSTSYIEALVADIPTVVLWNKETYHLDDKYASFFDSLASAGVFQAEPVQAATFVERIWRDPQAWWQSPAVRSARADFLSSNIGDARTMISHLVARANDAAPLDADAGGTG
jgi:putative transferase (TIGR04331 family)